MKDESEQEPELEPEPIQKVQVSVTRTATVRGADHDQVVYELEVTDGVVKIRRVPNRRGGVRLVDLATAIKELGV